MNFTDLEWLHAPKAFQADPGRLQLSTSPRTDFWQRTHYGFRRDDGHFLFALQKGDFVAEIAVEIEPNAEFDQAGLMVRLSPSCWLKTSCEYQPQRPSQFGAVVTNAGYSDWSYRPLTAFPSRTGFRIERQRADFLISARVGDGGFEIVRIAHLLEDDGVGPVMVGPYACSPNGDGCSATFAGFSIDGEWPPR